MKKQKSEKKRRRDETRAARRRARLQAEIVDRSVGVTPEERARRTHAVSQERLAELNAKANRELAKQWAKAA